MTEAIHTLYRPTSFDEVVGQKAVINSLQKVIERRGSQSFLFTGPSGTGKTTLARITAHEYGCDGSNIMEIPAAIYTGVDQMREVQEQVKYTPLGVSKQRAVILDECHRLSGSSWDSLLKSVEEPPPHMLWLFLTTEISKVPNTIQTRCTKFTLQPVPDNDLYDLIENIAKSEKIRLAEGVAQLIVREAHGSPRQALVFLAECRDCATRQEAAQVLRAVLDTNAVLELCRLVVSGGSWKRAMVIFAKCKEENPEGVRIRVCHYLAKALAGADSNDKACRLLQKLDAFATAYNQSDGMAPLLVSIGRALFMEAEEEEDD